MNRMRTTCIEMTSRSLLLLACFECDGAYCHCRVEMLKQRKSIHLMTCVTSWEEATIT